MQVLPPGLSGLSEFKQFVLWKLKKLPNGKETKVPVASSGYEVNPHDPANWLSFEQAAEHSKTSGYSVGFVFTTGDPFFFVDIDKCLVNGAWSELAVKLCRQFSGAAVEVSQSGAGLHIFARGSAPPHAKKNIALGLEFYTEARFVALTGTNVRGDVNTHHDATLSAFVAEYMEPKAGTEFNAEEWSDEPRDDWNGPEDDDELVEKMLASVSRTAAFTGRATVRDLWECNVDALAESYPDGEGLRSYDGSSADAALAAHLAFWTGCDCERISRLMKKSGLARDKYDDREDYLPRTIGGAVARCERVYSNTRPTVDVKPVDLEATKPSTETKLVDGFQFLTIDQQVEYFKGCVYVTDLHRVFTPWGDLLRPDRFKSRFGGYEFALDRANEKTTRNAFDAFTESQGVRFPKVDGVKFLPQDATGHIVEIDGRSFVNTYVEIATPRKAGDATPFLSHVEKILPDEHDRAIILAYMAACIQYKGVKFDWCPLIQGPEGNGKTLLTRCVKFGIGARYTHMPKASKIDSEFNAWLVNTIFVGVEDIFVPSHRQEVIETLKPMITGGDGLEIQQKGVDQITGESCANFMLNSNHRDAIRKTENDRRFCVFYTYQQSNKDIIRDGLTEDYFFDLYEWLKADGYAIVNEYLSTYAIPDALNPATHCRRAPITSTTGEAIEETLGGIEQEIREATEEGRPGFSGGWVSSLALDRFLVQIGAARRITPRKRWKMLEELGYIEHPHLVKGRTSAATMTDDGRPRLFVKAGHLSLNMKTPAEIAKAYDEAQAPSVPGSSLADSAFAKK